MRRAKPGIHARRSGQAVECLTQFAEGIALFTEESTKGGEVSSAGGYDDGGGSRAGTAYAERQYSYGRGMGFGGAYGRQRQSYPIETKPFFLTSEFLFRCSPGSGC